MRQRDIAYATGVYVGTRAVLVLAAWASLALFPPDLAPEHWRVFPDRLWLDGWARWDSAWYRTIFEQGYFYEPGRPSNVNFLPLYPWIAGLLSLPLRGALGVEDAFFVAALAVAHLSSWLAVLGLHDLVRARHGRAAADGAAWLLCVYPFSFFLGAAYSEGLFLALAIWAFRLADHDRWLPACALAALAAITRIPGFLVAVGLALAYLERRGPDPRAWGREALAFLLAPVPLLLLMGSFQARFGDPLVFVTTQREVWGRQPGLDLPAHWAMLTGGGLSWVGWTVTAWRVALLPVIPVAAALAWRRLGAPLGIYTFLVLALPASSGLQALDRYFLAAFPAFGALGVSLRGRAARTAALALLLPWLVYFTCAFARWGPLAGGAR